MEIACWLRLFAMTPGRGRNGTLEGKVALITGRGPASAARPPSCCPRGCVAIAEVDAAAGEEMAPAGNGAIAIRTDVTDEASMEAAACATAQQFGGLHVLHNNAGGSTPQTTR
jgi:NAD(P)-dependent dehydrogenase (short-subunit alcohol dehydrogenase family)